MRIEDLIIKPVKDFEGYFISQCGKVISEKSGKPKIMTTWFGSSGYEMLKLSKNGKTYHKQVHRLVGQEFVDNPENKPEIHHLDNNPKNNHYKNLQWVTRKENLSHSYKTLSPIRYYKECELHHIDRGFIKSFMSKKEACEYAYNQYGCSKDSLMKYLKTGDYKLIVKV